MKGKYFYGYSVKNIAPNNVAENVTSTLSKCMVKFGLLLPKGRVLKRFF